jgi:predicted nucleic acid-binding protein
MAESYVFDSYAVLAYQFGEESKGKVKEILLAAESGRANLYLNLINLGEVYYIIHRNKNEAIANRAIGMVKRWPLEIIVPDERITLMAARIKARYSGAKHPLSYADTFAIATAVDRNAVIVTGDPEMKNVESIVEIFWLEHA